jgi:hypothetical protein
VWQGDTTIPAVVSQLCVHIAQPRVQETQVPVPCSCKDHQQEAVSAYYVELEKLLRKYDLKDKTQYIYNVDEKGMTDNHDPPKIVADKRTTPVAVTAGMSCTISVLGAGNALGTSIPPVFVFPG